MKLIAHRVVQCGLKAPLWYHFHWRKTTVGWLQRATWKKSYMVQLKSVAFLQNYKIIALKCKKNVSIWENWQKWTLILSLTEIPKIFICVRFFSEDWKSYPSEAVSLRLLLWKCVKGKHIKKRRDKTCLSFSTRYSL